MPRPQGKQVELQNLTTTRSRIAASQGDDFEEIAEEVAQEEAFIQSLEDEYGVKLPTLSQDQVPNEQNQPANGD